MTPTSKFSVNSSYESRPLLSPSSLPTVSHSTRERLATCFRNTFPKFLCRLSKPAVAIIVINIIVSAAFATLMNVIMAVGYFYHGFTIYIITLYSIVAALTLFSPLGGFLADVCFGRYKVVMAGVFVQFFTFLLYSVMAVVTVIFGRNIWITSHHSHGGGIALFLLILAVLSFLLFVVGLVSYQANFIQFGLDQLLEAPSTSLALFVHWVIWGESLGTFVVQILFGFLLCQFRVFNLENLINPVCGVVLLITVLFLHILLLSRSRWFYVEPSHYNPYKMVAKILSFARRHKYPLQRSAFTYAGDEFPSRIDFAKERYGGPFSTEQVENVKTFFRILLILVALGPVFVLEVPTSFFMYIIFSIHTGHSPFLLNQTCSASFILLDKGSFVNLVGVVLYPIYMWLVFFAFRRCLLKIFVRLVLSVALYIVGVISMLSIDVAGHYRIKEVARNTSFCMFFVTAGDRHTINAEPVLGLPVAVLLIPGLLLGLGSPLVMATTFEFISAQSPLSMKGLLVGVFFTIKAFFQLVSGITFLPFSTERFWTSVTMLGPASVMSCGSSYLITTSACALVGLLFLLLAVKKYKYRERDDRPYDQRFVVDVYDRYIEQAYSNRSNYDYYDDDS